MRHPKTVIEQVAADLRDFVTKPDNYPVAFRSVTADELETLAKASLILDRAVQRRAGWEAHSLNTDFAWLLRRENELVEDDEQLDREWAEVLTAVMTNQPTTERKHMIHALTADDTVTANFPRAYLFLDVDGVINPIRWVDQPGWHREMIHGYRVWVGEPLSAWLNDLLNQGIQIVWATTWIESDEAITELATKWNLPLDLPRISRLSWDTADELRQDCGKRFGVDEYIETHGIDPTVTPVAWVDDMIGPGDLRYAKAKGIHAVPVDPDVGLSSQQWREQVERHLESNQPTLVAI